MSQRLEPGKTHRLVFKWRHVSVFRWLQHQLQLLTWGISHLWFDLLSCWNNASSMVVLSSTVMDTTATGASAPRGKTPGTRTSCQSE